MQTQTNLSLRSQWKWAQTRALTPDANEWTQSAYIACRYIYCLFISLLLSLCWIFRYVYISMLLIKLNGVCTLAAKLDATHIYRNCRINAELDACVCVCLWLSFLINIYPSIYLSIEMNAQRAHTHSTSDDTARGRIITKTISLDKWLNGWVLECWRNICVCLVGTIKADPQSYIRLNR